MELLQILTLTKVIEAEVLNKDINVICSRTYKNHFEDYAEYTQIDNKHFATYLYKG